MASIEKRQTEAGASNYRVKVRLKGFPTQTGTFKRLTDARRWAQQTEAAIREGRYFKTSEAKRHTLDDAISRYLKSVMPNKPKAIKDQTLQLKYWCTQLGKYSLAEITPALVAEHKDKLAQGMTIFKKVRSPATVNRYLVPGRNRIKAY